MLASLIRLLGNFDLAEEAVHDAFAAAIEEWPKRGMPDSPWRWLVSADTSTLAAGWRVGDPFASHVLMPVYVGILLWVGLYLRDERLRGLVFTS